MCVVVLAALRITQLREPKAKPRERAGKAAPVRSHAAAQKEKRARGGVGGRGRREAGRLSTLLHSRSSPREEREEAGRWSMGEERTWSGGWAGRGEAEEEDGCGGGGGGGEL